MSEDLLTGQDSSTGADRKVKVSPSGEVLTLVTGMPTSLGQAAMAASSPVVIASDQTAIPVQGNVASGATDAGNPVGVGSAANSGTPTPVTSGQRVKLWLGLSGQTIIGTNTTAFGDASPAGMLTDPAGTARLLSVAPGLYNGSNYDRQRNNHEVTALASAARAVTTNIDVTTYNARYATITIDVTAVTGSPSLVITVRYKDSLSGKYVNIVATIAITATGTTTLQIGPGLTPAANSVANAALPRVINVLYTPGTADSITASVSINLSI